MTDPYNRLLPPRLHSQAIAVWVLGPMAVAAVSSSPQSLSPAELARAARIARPDKRREFIAARQALRRFLAQHSGGDSPDVALDCATGPLRLGRGCSELTCSISHRHGRIALALSSAGPVGIDMEHVVPRIAHSLASVFLHKPAWHHVPQIEPLRLFSAWCELEAFVKIQQTNLPACLPQWQQFCLSAGLPAAIAQVRYFRDIRLSHWEPYPMWRLVLASGSNACIHIRIDV